MTNMGPVICIAGQKGGVGKTTIAINLSAALAVAEKRTLLVDCDPQGNATTGMGIDKGRLKKRLNQGLMDAVVPEDVVIDSHLEFLKIIPAGTGLVRTESELNSRPNKEMVLQSMLSSIKKAYDYIIIDTPPAHGLLSINAMCAADSVLVPLQCEFYALEGLGQLLCTYNFVKKHLNRGLTFGGIVLTMFDAGEKICRNIVKEVRTNFRDKVFKTIIPRDVQLRESPCFGKPLLLLDIMSTGARSYFQLAREVMSHGP